MPIGFMLLFVYVFGGAIDSGSDSYVGYLLPGILIMTIASGIAYTAYRLFLDMRSGIFERFQSMPIARSSVLWAHVLTSLVANMISIIAVVLVALLMGFRSGAGVEAWLAVTGILILFTLALTSIAVIPGLTARPWMVQARSPTPQTPRWLTTRHTLPERSPRAPPARDYRRAYFSAPEVRPATIRRCNSTKTARIGVT